MGSGPLWDRWDTVGRTGRRADRGTACSLRLVRLRASLPGCGATHGLEDRRRARTQAQSLRRLKRRRYSA